MISKCSIKLKSIYAKKGLKQNDIANSFESSKQYMSYKMQVAEKRFSFLELIKFADIFNMKIAFIDEENNIVEKFDINDIE